MGKRERERKREKERKNERRKERKEERESSISSGCNGWRRARPKPEVVGFPRGCRDSGTWAVFHDLPRLINSELHQK